MSSVGESAVSVTSGETGESSEMPTDEEVFEVDFVVDMRGEETGAPQYRIRWKTYGPESDTWEPEENLLGGCRELVEDFLRRRRVETEEIAAATRQQNQKPSPKKKEPGKKQTASSRAESFGNKKKGRSKQNQEKTRTPQKKRVLSSSSDEAKAEETAVDQTESAAAFEKEAVESKSSAPEKKRTEKHGRGQKRKRQPVIEDSSDDNPDLETPGPQEETSRDANEESDKSSDTTPTPPTPPPGYTADPRKLLKDPFWHELQFGKGEEILNKIGGSRRTRSSGQNSTPASSVSVTSERGRGRPPRPRSPRSNESGNDMNLKLSPSPAPSAGSSASGRRGRPRKVRGGKTAQPPKSVTPEPTKKGRGRPKKIRPPVSESEEEYEKKEDKQPEKNNKEETRRNKLEVPVPTKKTVDKPKQKEDKTGKTERPQEFRKDRSEEAEDQTGESEKADRRKSEEAMKPLPRKSPRKPVVASSPSPKKPAPSGKSPSKSPSSATLASREKTIEDSISAVLGKTSDETSLREAVSNESCILEDRAKVTSEMVKKPEELVEARVRKQEEASKKQENVQAEVRGHQTEEKRTPPDARKIRRESAETEKTAEVSKHRSRESTEQERPQEVSKQRSYSSEQPLPCIAPGPSGSDVRRTSPESKRPIFDRDLPLKVSVDLDLAAFFRNEMRIGQTHPGKGCSQKDFRNACLCGDANTVRLATQFMTKNRDTFKLDVENLDEYGNSLLMQVSNRQCDPAHQADDILELLVNAGAQVNRQNTASGYSALHFAVERSSLCKVTKLLSFKASVNLGDRDRVTPLMLAARKGFSHIVYRLLEAGADFNAFADVQTLNANGGYQTVQKSALNLAEENGQKRCVDMLSEHMNKVKVGFDSALGMVLQEIKIKRQMCPLHCYALSEAESFRVVFPFENVPLPNERYGYITVCALAKFQAQQVTVKLWGPCPIRSVELNGSGQHHLQQEGKFIFACWPLQTGPNTITVHCKEDCRESQMKLMIQVLLVQLKQPKEIDFTGGK